VNATAEGTASHIRFEVSLEGKIVTSETVTVSHITSVTFHISNPELWYPIRYGKQPLYSIKAVLIQDETEIDTMTKRFGLRRAELIQRELKDQPGTSFFFQVNNIPIFCGGSNWIPADNFIPRISKRDIGIGLNWSPMATSS